MSLEDQLAENNRLLREMLAENNRLLREILEQILRRAQSAQSPQAPPPEREGSSSMLTVDETAQLMKVSTSSLNRWRKSGTGPKFSKLGGLVRYRRADLTEYIQQGAWRGSEEAITEPPL